MNKLINLIISILEEYVQPERGIKMITFDDTFEIPQNSMPAIVVIPNTTNVTTQDTAFDRNTYNVTIKLILNAGMYFNKSKTRDNTIYEATKIMEELDDDDQLKDDCILGAIRQQLYDNSFLLNTIDETIEYQFKDLRGFKTVEVILNFNAIKDVYLRNS